MRVLPVTLLGWNELSYAQSDQLIVSSAVAEVMVPSCQNEFHSSKRSLLFCALVSFSFYS